MNTDSSPGRNALITGASSGIGAAIARDLAQRGWNVILVARREDKLRALQADIEQAYKVKATVIPLDLTQPGAAEVLYQQTEGHGLVIDMLVNNAGYAIFGNYPEVSWERERNLYELDMIVLAQLTRLFVKAMLPRKRGHIMLVASIMGLMPVPTYTIYAASKAFVINYGRSLSYELRNTGVSVTVIAPGTTESEFLQVSGQPMSLAEKVTMMSNQRVARLSVEATLKRKSFVITGKRNILSVLLINLLPARLAIWLTYTLMVYAP